MLVLLALGCSENGLSSTEQSGVAVTYGDFDDLTPSLDRLGVSHDIYEGIISTPTWADGEVSGVPVETLFSGRRLTQDAILVASGTRGLGQTVYNRNATDDLLVSDPAVLDATGNYVRDGGRLLVTDWAYDLVEQTWPDAIDFHGDDAVFDAAQQGEPGDVLARVVDPVLAEALGMEQLVVRYDFSNWAVITDVAPDTRVWLRGDVEVWNGDAVETLADVPLLVSHETDRGTAAVMTFHADAQPFAVADTLLATVLGELPGLD